MAIAPYAISTQITSYNGGEQELRKTTILLDPKEANYGALTRKVEAVVREKCRTPITLNVFVPTFARVHVSGRESTPIAGVWEAGEDPGKMYQTELGLRDGETLYVDDDGELFVAARPSCTATSRRARRCAGSRGLAPSATSPSWRRRALALSQTQTPCRSKRSQARTFSFRSAQARLSASSSKSCRIKRASRPISSD